MKHVPYKMEFILIVYYWSRLSMASQKIVGIKEIAHLYNNFFFDLDGVLVICSIIISGEGTSPFRDL